MPFLALRYGLPAVLVIAGFVILFTVDGSLRWEGWAMCVGSGLAILLMNALYRFGSAGDREREQESAAREYYAAHGYWPGEGPK
jgi:high-affinity Fe2+/Pb2+ permease